MRWRFQDTGKLLGDSNVFLIVCSMYNVHGIPVIPVYSPMYTGDSDVHVRGMWGSSHHRHRPWPKTLKALLHETRDPEVLELEKRPRASLFTSLGQDTERSLNILRVWSSKNALHVMCEFQTHKIHKAQPSNRDYLKSLWSWIWFLEIRRQQFLKGLSVIKNCFLTQHCNQLYCNFKKPIFMDTFFLKEWEKQRRAGMDVFCLICILLGGTNCHSLLKWFFIDSGSLNEMISVFSQIFKNMLPKTSDFTLFMPSYIAFKNFAVLRGRATVTTDKLIVEILKPTPK